MFSTEEKGDEGKVEAALPLDKGGWVEAKLVELEDMIKQLHVGMRPPLTDEGIVPPVQRDPQPTLTPSIIAGLDPPPPPPPVESLFSPPPLPAWKREEEKHWLPPLFAEGGERGARAGGLNGRVSSLSCAAASRAAAKTVLCNSLETIERAESCLCSVWPFRSFYTYCFGDHGS